MEEVPSQELMLEELPAQGMLEVIFGGRGGASTGAAGGATGHGGTGGTATRRVSPTQLNNKQIFNVY